MEFLTDFGIRCLMERDKQEGELIRNLNTYLKQQIKDTPAKAEQDGNPKLVCSSCKIEMARTDVLGDYGLEKTYRCVGCDVGVSVTAPRTEQK